MNRKLCHALAIIAVMQLLGATTQPATQPSGGDDVYVPPTAPTSVFRDRANVPTAGRYNTTALAEKCDKALDQYLRTHKLTKEEGQSLAAGDIKIGMTIEEVALLGQMDISSETATTKKFDFFPFPYLRFSNSASTTLVFSDGKLARIDY